MKKRKVEETMRKFTQNTWFSEPLLYKMDVRQSIAHRKNGRLVGIVGSRRMMALCGMLRNCWETCRSWKSLETNDGNQMLLKAPEVAFQAHCCWLLLTIVFSVAWKRKFYIQSERPPPFQTVGNTHWVYWVIPTGYMYDWTLPVWPINWKSSIA